MKFLLFTIFLGVAYANTLNPENQGEWRLVRIAANNKEKIEEGGDLRAYLENIDCQDEECHEVGLFFDAKHNEECQSFSLVGKKENAQASYLVDYEGNNVFDFCYQSKTAIVICAKNIDENGLETYVVEIGVRPGGELREEDNAAFLRLMKEHGIPENHVFELSQEDPCP